MRRPGRPRPCSRREKRTNNSPSGPTPPKLMKGCARRFPDDPTAPSRQRPGWRPRRKQAGWRGREGFQGWCRLIGSDPELPVDPPRGTRLAGAVVVPASPRRAAGCGAAAARPRSVHRTLTNRSRGPFPPAAPVENDSRRTPSMPRLLFATTPHSRTVHRTTVLALALGVVAVLGAAGPAGLDPRSEVATDPAAVSASPALAPASGLDLDVLIGQARKLTLAASAWYERTPPADRVTWGGLAAAAGLALGVLAERWRRWRPRRIIPADFPTRFLERLQDGRLDRGKALILRAQRQPGRAGRAGRGEALGTAGGRPRARRGPGPPGRGRATPAPRGHAPADRRAEPPARPARLADGCEPDPGRPGHSLLGPGVGPCLAAAPGP